MDNWTCAWPSVLLRDAAYYLSKNHATPYGKARAHFCSCNECEINGLGYNAYIHTYVHVRGIQHLECSAGESLHSKLSQSINSTRLIDE